jgi:hypothetical protein
VGIDADGALTPVDGPEVALVVDGRRWSDAEMAVSEITEAPGAARMSWLLRVGDLAVRMVAEADGAAGVVRKWAEVTGRGRLQAVELERWSGPAVTGFVATGEPVAYNAGAPGLGQPVFGPGFFAGIEHPVAENLVTAGGTGCTCALPLAVDLGPAPFRTPASVVGAGGLDDFWDYVDTLRPVPARLVTLTNNWYHLGATGRMDEASVTAELAGFAAVADRHGLALDFVALDDGWDGGAEADWDDATGLWGRMAPARFPTALAGRGDGEPGPGIGLWLSPFGGYGDRCAARVAWAGDHGLEVEHAAAALCVAGARYRADLARALTTWTAAGVGYWKLDGVRFTCDEPDHGHPVGAGARTAQVDAFRELVAEVRGVRPDAVVAFTIGSHPSPWWLASVDFLWRGGLDDTAVDGAGSRLDRFDTYIDSCLHAYRRCALPTSALVTFSVVQSEAASYRDDEADLDAWARHCWLAVGRGTLHQDLYVSPDSVSEDEWEVLAAALAWARATEHVLARSRMVLGDPSRGEVYGFVARRGPAAVVCLRNPSAESRTLDADWPERAGLPDLAEVDLTTRFGPPPPAGGRVGLGPFEVVVLEVRWASV